jgi:hypothetical protein
VVALVVVEVELAGLVETVVVVVDVGSRGALVADTVVDVVRGVVVDETVGTVVREATTPADSAGCDGTRDTASIVVSDDVSGSSAAATPCDGRAVTDDTSTNANAEPNAPTTYFRLMTRFATFPTLSQYVQSWSGRTTRCGYADTICGSLGKERIRSPTILRWISAVPPQIVSLRLKKNADIMPLAT